MKIIRWWGIIAFVVILLLLGLTWYLLAPRFIASSIETAGSEALGAQVNVGSVDLSVFPLGVQLNHLQATDPDAPMSNLFEAETIKMSIDAGDLLWRKIVIDELVFTGIKTQTPREQSGELIGGRKSAQAAGKLVELVIPDTGSFDVKEMIEKADLVTLKRVDDFKKKQQQIKSEWDSALDKEAFKKRSDAIKKEFDRLSNRAKENKLNLVKDRKEWKQLKQTIDTEREQIASLSKKLKADKAALSNQFNSIKKGPSDDLDAIMSKAGLGNGIDGLVDKYLGPQYTPWVKRAIEMTQSLDSGEKTEETTEKEFVTVGNRVYFKDEKIFPDVLVKTVKLSGEGKQWTLKGDGMNLGYLPWLTGNPAKLDLNFSGKGKADLAIKSDWKTPQKMQSTLNSNVKGWALDSMVLMATKEGNWSIESGTLDAEIKGELTLEKIDLKAVFKIDAPKITYPESLSGWQAGLAKSINQQTSINLELTASGSVKSPKIKLDSSLEKLFQKAIGAQLNEKAQALRGDVENKLKEKIGDLSALENYQAQFQQWQQGLNQNNQLLEDIKNKIKL